MVVVSVGMNEVTRNNNSIIGNKIYFTARAAKC